MNAVSGGPDDRTFCNGRFGVAEFQKVGALMVEVLDGLAANREDNSAVEDKVRKEVLELTARFPIYK